MQFNKLYSSLFLLITFVIALALDSVPRVEAGGKGKGKGGGDIILYKGNIVMRGEGGKKGGDGSIVVANQDQGGSGEEIDPMSYFLPFMGGMGGMGRRR